MSASDDRVLVGKTAQRARRWALWVAIAGARPRLATALTTGFFGPAKSL